MDWNELQRLARDTFPGKTPTVPVLLTVWGQHDADGELGTLIEPAGLTGTALIAAMRPLISACAESDTKLITDCIMSAGDFLVTGCHLLKAICDHPENAVSRALVAAGLRIPDLRKALDKKEPAPALTTLARHGIAVDANVSPLLRYGRDLTALAKEGLFDSYCERPEELEQVITVLMRMERGNPALTGEAGVGKTALVELLAREVGADRIGGIVSETRIFEISCG